MSPLDYELGVVVFSRFSKKKQPPHLSWEIKQEEYEVTLLPLLQASMILKLTACLISSETIISEPVRLCLLLLKKSDLGNEKALFNDDPSIHKLLP